MDVYCDVRSEDVAAGQRRQHGVADRWVGAGNTDVQYTRLDGSVCQLILIRLQQKCALCMTSMVCVYAAFYQSSNSLKLMLTWHNSLTHTLLVILASFLISAWRH